MRFVSENTKTVYFKYYMRDKFQSAEIVKCERIEEEIPQKYKQKIFISAAKKRYLLSLSKSGRIPKEYHDYYKHYHRTILFRMYFQNQTQKSLMNMKKLINA